MGILRKIRQLPIRNKSKKTNTNFHGDKTIFRYGKMSASIATRGGRPKSVFYMPFQHVYEKPIHTNLPPFMASEDIRETRRRKLN